jgi:hypothetical protein
MSDTTRLASLRNEIEYLKTSGRKEALVPVELLEYLLFKGEAVLRCRKLAEAWVETKGESAALASAQLVAAIDGTGSGV